MNNWGLRRHLVRQLYSSSDVSVIFLSLRDSNVIKVLLLEKASYTRGTRMTDDVALICFYVIAMDDKNLINIFLTFELKQFSVLCLTTDISYADVNVFGSLKPVTYSLSDQSILWLSV